MWRCLQIAKRENKESSEEEQEKCKDFNLVTIIKVAILKKVAAKNQTGALSKRNPWVTNLINQHLRLKNLILYFNLHQQLKINLGMNYLNQKLEVCPQILQRKWVNHK